MIPPSTEPGQPDESAGARQVVRAEGGFAYGVIGASVHVFGDGVPLYVLENWRPAPQADQDFLRHVPSRMLNARFAVVEFTGRQQELAELRNWRDQPSRLAARWLHAPAGQGKTRLAFQLAEDSLAAGWKVVTAAHGPGTVLPPPGSQDLRLDDAEGVLLIIDYADRWPLSHLTWLFSNALLHQPVRARVLMLARGDDAWPAVRATLVNTQVDISKQHLPELPDEVDQRTEMFTVARDGFAGRYAIDDVGSIRPPGPLDHPDFGLTLAVHIAALVAVDAHARGTQPPDDMVGLTIYLLDREHAHWARLYGDGTHELDVADRTYRTPPAVMNRAVFTAALTGALPRSTGAGVVADLDPPAHPGQVLSDHTTCYPPVDPRRDTVLEPLYPDRLAEDFLALTLPGHPADYPAQRWADTAASALLTRGADDAPAVWTRRALTFLAAAAERWPHVGPEHLFPFLRDDPQLAVDAGSPALVALAGLAELPSELVEDITDAFPHDIPADLATGRAAIGVRHCRNILATDDGPATQSIFHLVLGDHQDTLGLTDEAAQTMRRGVTIRRELVEVTADGPGHASQQALLAQALSNLSNQLSKAGMTAEAIGAGLEAVDLNRRLAQAEPGAGHDFHLAVTLSNLGTKLHGAGQTADAVTAQWEAVNIYRQLTDADPAAYESGLAVSLTNLGSSLSRAKVPEEALKVTREAVEIWRRLAETNPTAHESDLATALINTVSMSTDSERPRDGLSDIRQASAILRRLAQAHPRAYEAGFANSLNLLSTASADGGDIPEAVEAAEEAVEIRRKLTATEATARNEVSLAQALTALADRYRTAGHKQKAAAAKAEAAAKLRQVTQWMDSSGWAHPLAPPENLRRRRLRSTSPAVAEAAGDDTATTVLSPRRRKRKGRPEPRPVPWGTGGDIDAAARRLLHARNWPALWDLTCSVPIVDACRLAALLLKRWSPPDDLGRAIARSLASVDHRRAQRLLKACSKLPPRTLGGYFIAPRLASFAHGRQAMALQELHPETKEESVTLYDLRRGRPTHSHREATRHGSVSCLTPHAAIAIRPHDHAAGAHRLVSYVDDATHLLTANPAMVGASTAATAHGFVVGLDLAPSAYVGADGRPLRHVDLSEFGLWRGSFLAVDPTGTRLAISDGTQLTVTDARLESAIAAAQIPAPGELRDVAFAGQDKLLVSLSDGGLAVWRLDVGALYELAFASTPRLDDLFAIPAWCTVGGTGDGRPCFYDLDSLAPLEVPRPVLGGDDSAAHLRAFTASPDGRYVLYGGHFRQGRTWDWRTVLHDLHDPANWIQRPLASISAADLPALDALVSGSRWSNLDGDRGELVSLLQLTCDVATYRFGEDG